MKVSRGKTLIVVVLAALVLLSFSPVTVRAGTGMKYAYDTATIGGASITITVRGYFIYGQYRFYSVTHTLSVVMPLFYSWNGACYYYGEGYNGQSTYEIYSGYLFYPGSYTYDDTPYVNSKAYTSFYGIIFYWGFPVLTADLYCEIFPDS